jgi:hypothetical protein
VSRCRSPVIPTFRRLPPMTPLFQTLRSLSLCRFRPIHSLRQPRPCVSQIVRRLRAIRLRANRPDWPESCAPSQSESGLSVIHLFKDGKPSLISRLRAGDSPKLSRRVSHHPSRARARGPMKRPPRRDIHGKSLEIRRLHFAMFNFDFLIYNRQREFFFRSAGFPQPALRESIS